MGGDKTLQIVDSEIRLPSASPPSQVAQTKLEALIKLYPSPKSAIMPALYLVQEEAGTITEEGILWVAKNLNLSPIHVREVATFYTMYYKKPVARYHFQVCRTLPCALRGAARISEYLHRKFSLLPGEISNDGMFSYDEVECLGSCGTAPMCQINDLFFENLDEAKLDSLIEEIKRGRPNFTLSTLHERLGDEKL